MQHIVIDNVEHALQRLFSASIKAAFPQLPPVEAGIVLGKKFADYQCNNAMGLTKLLATAQAAAAKANPEAPPAPKMTPQQIADQLVQNLPPNDLIGKADSTAQGFVNITIAKSWTCSAVKRILQRGVVAPELEKKEKVLVDFSSPNIAKEMHVGHLRSTIIGESLCRVFEFLGHDVERINHVGDWGTQFGMLILYMKTKYPSFLESPPPISDLVAFYKEAKVKFDEDADFKDKARMEVVKLQSYDEVSVKAWKMICDISRVEFEEIYSRLQVRLDERGESFYNKMLPDVVKELTDLGLVEVNDGAHIIVSTRNVPVNAVTAKDMAKVLIYFVQPRKAGGVEWDPVMVKLLKEIKVMTNSQEDGSGEDMIQVSKKEKKKFSAFDIMMDNDKLSLMLEPLHKPALHPALVEALRARNGIVEAPSSKKKVAADAGAAAAAAAAASSEEDVPQVKVPIYNIPLMLKKSDGGFSYDSTDLAAMKHRFVLEKKDRVVYVTDVGQYGHFEMVAQAATDAGWIKSTQRWDHAGFGLVTGEDGKKLKTRSGETTKLKDLLDEACERALAGLEEREKKPETAQGHTKDEMVALSKKIGFGAVKYFDLRQNRLSDYAFSFDKVLDFNGNTAVYLLYSYARICSVKRKANITDVMTLVANTEIDFETDQEKNLVLAALRLGPVLLKTAEDLSPKNITDFAYELVGAFSDFYNKCKVIGNEKQNSRLLLIEVVGITIRTALRLLGIEVAEKL